MNIPRVYWLRNDLEIMKIMAEENMLPLLNKPRHPTANMAFMHFTDQADTRVYLVVQHWGHERPEDNGLELFAVPLSIGLEKAAQILVQIQAGYEPTAVTNPEIIDRKPSTVN